MLIGNKVGRKKSRRLTIHDKDYGSPEKKNIDFGIGIIVNQKLKKNAVDIN